jgi:hypothetical protein
VQGISKDEIKQLAYETGFVKRTSRKIEADEFLELMCLESQKGSPSYNDLASRHEAVYKKCATKQAVSKKVNKSSVLFFQTILSHIIKSKLPISDIEVVSRIKKYKRIIVQDSTIIKLPLRLFKVFSGVSNAHSSVCNARIQGVYNLLSGTFISFSIDSYSKNDLSVASQLELHIGDLVLRDRGYFLPSEMKRHVEKGADCIYRFKTKTILFDPQSLEPINLLKLLKSAGSIDIQVCLNDEYRTEVRLVASPVCEEVANQRRMKAKKEACGHNPSKEVLDLMAWTIFLTTIPEEQVDFHKILTIYGLRWRIEIIFKSWKSNMSFAKIHNVSENQLRILLTARFIMIIICMHYIFTPWSGKIREKYKREISFIKLIAYLMKNLEKLLEMCSLEQYRRISLNESVEFALMRYCCYDKRKRLNFSQLSAIATN